MPKPLTSLLLATALTAAGALPSLAQEACGIVVFFDSGQAAVDAADDAALSAFVAANPGAALSVTGFTDAAGSAASNQALSQRRAEMVAGVLTGTGGVSIASVQGLGEAVRPGTSGPTDPSNRRVEVASVDCGTTPVAAGPFAGASGLAVAGGVGALALVAAAGSDSGSSSTSSTD